MQNHFGRDGRMGLCILKRKVRIRHSNFCKRRSSLPFSELTNNFTQYPLQENVIGFQSSYSIRFYGIRKRLGGGEKTSELDWIKEKFEIQE
jgi:plasmid replication initiation protein